MQSIATHDRSGTDGGRALKLDHVAVLLDGTEADEIVVAHARALARACGGRVTLLQVLEGRPHGDEPADPLDWDIRRREAREHVQALLRSSDGSVPMNAEVLEGRLADETRAWAERNAVDLTVVRDRRPRSPDRSFAHAILDRLPGSVLFVRGGTQRPRDDGYHRILVPLDGSPRAESALPLAVSLADTADAELVLAHVVPGPGLTEVGPLDTEDVDLVGRITERNARVGAAYLEQVRSRFAHREPPPRVVVLENGEVRARLGRLIEDEGVDLVVMTSHGQSGRANVPCGSVTSDLVLRTTTSLLVVRPPHAPADARRSVPGAAGRLPTQAAS